MSSLAPTPNPLRELLTLVSEALHLADMAPQKRKADNDQQHIGSVSWAVHISCEDPVANVAADKATPEYWSIDRSPSYAEDDHQRTSQGCL